MTIELVVVRTRLFRNDLVPFGEGMGFLAIRCKSGRVPHRFIPVFTPDAITVTLPGGPMKHCRIEGDFELTTECAQQTFGIEQEFATTYEQLRADFNAAVGKLQHAETERVAAEQAQAFVVDNLLPVTLGNIIGGGLLVGVVYWFIYRRKAE